MPGCHAPASRVRWEKYSTSTHICACGLHPAASPTASTSWALILPESQPERARTSDPHGCEPCALWTQKTKRATEFGLSQWLQGLEYHSPQAFTGEARLDRCQYLSGQSLNISPLLIMPTRLDRTTISLDPLTYPCPAPLIPANQPATIRGERQAVDGDIVRKQRAALPTRYPHVLSSDPLATC